MNSEDNDIRTWARSALFNGGSFVKAMGNALLAADNFNFEILRPAALQLIKKYPGYLRPDREPRHQIGCICADCSGAELTAEND